MGSRADRVGIELRDGVVFEGASAFENAGNGGRQQERELQRTRADAKVELVDVGGGNLGSVRRCLTRLGVTIVETGADKRPSGDLPLVLPGVGAFGTVMQSLRRNQVDDLIKKLALQGTPLLGICAGMQVLFDSSEEAPGVEGLGLIGGDVVRFSHAKVPQIGWNSITPEQPGLQCGFAYFVNSYFARPVSRGTVLYSASYGGRFCAAVKQDNITGFQFHPEKSGAFGLQMLWQWLNDVER